MRFHDGGTRSCNVERSYGEGRRCGGVLMKVTFLLSTTGRVFGFQTGYDLLSSL